MFDIERQYKEGRPIKLIKADFKLPQGSMERHAHCFTHLEEKRKGNRLRLLDLALEAAIEQIPDMEFKPKDLSDMLIARARLTGELVNNFSDVTDQMKGKSEAELEHFAQHGDWVDESEAATEVEGPEAVQ